MQDSCSTGTTAAATEQADAEERDGEWVEKEIERRCRGEKLERLHGKTVSLEDGVHMLRVVHRHTMAKEGKRGEKEMLKKVRRTCECKSLALSSPSLALSARRC